VGDGFYRAKDPTNSIKVLKEEIIHSVRSESEQILNGTSAQNRLYSAIHVDIRWKICEKDKSRTNRSQKLDNPEKANNTKHSKT